MSEHGEHTESTNPSGELPGEPSGPAHPFPTIASPHPGGHERSDVNVRALVYAVIGLIVAAIVIHVALYFLFGLYGRQSRQERSRLPQTMVEMPPQVPLGDRPRLQGIPGFHTNTPRADMAIMNAQTSIVLSTYGPTTRPGMARVPIDRAMDLMLVNGMFKSRPATTKEAIAPPEGAAGAQPSGGDRAQ